MKGKFDISDKGYIEDFINNLKSEIKSNAVTLEYEVSDHNRYLGETYECPRGNAASEKWSDRMLSDTFEITDTIFYNVIKNEKKIGQIYFIKYLSKKILSEDINTINITNSFEDYFHIDEYYPGIGIVSERNHAKVKNFFNDKRENLSNIIKNK